MSRASLVGPAFYRSLLALLLTLMIGPALGNRLFAGPIPITLVGDVAGAEVTITYAAPTPDYPTGFTLNGYAGEMLLQSGNSEILGFCVDLAHFVAGGQTFLANPYLTNSPTNGLPNGGQVAYLANAYGSLPLSNIQGAALQIAIWSELYNNGTGFTSPADVFQYTAAENAGDPSYSAIATAATAYLHDAQGQSSVATWYDASANDANVTDQQWRGQSMVDPMPAPSSLVLSLVGLGCLGVASGWRRRLHFV